MSQSDKFLLPVTPLPMLIRAGRRITLVEKILAQNVSHIHSDITNTDKDDHIDKQVTVLILHLTDFTSLCEQYCLDSGFEVKIFHDEEKCRKHLLTFKQKDYSTGYPDLIITDGLHEDIYKFWFWCKRYFHFTEILVFDPFSHSSEKYPFDEVICGFSNTHYSIDNINSLEVFNRINMLLNDDYGSYDLSRNNVMSIIDYHLKNVVENPNSCEAWRMLGISFEMLLKFERCLYLHNNIIDSYQQAIRIDPEDSESWYELGMSYRWCSMLSPKNTYTNFEKALNALHHGVRFSPREARFWAGVGYTCKKLGRSYEAIDAFWTALGIDPNLCDDFLDAERSWCMLGELYESLGKYSTAILAYEQAAPYNPEMWTYRDPLYDLYEKLGQFSQAINACQRLLHAYPDSAEVWNRLGVMYKRICQYAKAVESYQKGLSIDPENKYLLYNLGIAFKGLGKHTKALDAFQQIVRNDQDDFEAWLDVGEAHITLGQYAEAVDAFKQVVRIYPEVCSEEDYLIYDRLNSLDQLTKDKLFSLIQAANTQGGTDA